ncbi:MAG: M23 family metallopeptidase [Lachnospiraceae bacterium]
MSGYKSVTRNLMIKDILKLISILCIEMLVITMLHHVIVRKAEVNDKKIKKQNMIQDKITMDMRYFPIPVAFRSRIYYEDSYGSKRLQGQHEGCDIMDYNNKPGEIPIISCCDGTITNIGWLYLGGYRIGIESSHNIYFYYAHLDSYADGLKIGQKVCRGQLLGFMGNSGEGEEGTVGKFPTHLHFGIYDCQNDFIAVNPYSYLKNVE